MIKQIQDKYKIINVHGHIKTNQTVLDMIDDWDEVGVVKFCALALGKQWQNHGYYGNEEVRKAMREFPDRVIGMGHLQLANEIDGPDKVEQLREWGFSGLKFISSEFPYYDERYFPLYEIAEKLNMPILFHVGILAQASDDRYYKINSEFLRPYTLDRVARSFPKLNLILGHPGDPHTQESLTLVDSFENVHLCPCGGGGSDFHMSKVKKILAPFPGADWDNPEENTAKRYFRKFAFGTDNPTAIKWYEQSIKLLDYFRIEEETRKAFFETNAARIFELKL